MIKTTFLLVTGILCFVFCSCGSNSALLEGTRDNKVDLLKDYCKAKNMQYPETAAADSLMNNLQIQPGSQQMFLARERAMVLYRISIMKFEMEQSNKELDSLRSAINADKEQLEKYSAIMEQLKEMRK
jgi:hypothetical protein